MLAQKALQLTIFPLLRNGKTAAELCVSLAIELISTSNQSRAERN
jgi:hypothetical protein